MRYIFLFMLLMPLQNILAQGFSRELPKEQLLSQITTKNFPHSDAVIILKEQSLKVETGQISYSGFNDYDLSFQHSRILIVKILNEIAVARYSTFEYKYQEYFGNDIPAGFEVRARVLKPSGDIEVVSEDDIHKIVSLADKNDEPLERKVIMKISNLSVGDLLQLEFSLTEPYRYATSGLFFFNDKDIVLYSNVYVTLPREFPVKTFSFPENAIGDPTVEQLSETYGSGNTYFWSVKNCNSIPDEPYSIPFEQMSYMSAFIVPKINFKYFDTWDKISANYYDRHIDRESLSKRFYEELNLPREIQSISWELVDSLYTQLKRNIRLKSENGIATAPDLMKTFDDKKADATDIAFMMFKALEEWKQTPAVVLIRDKRKGTFEKGLPSLYWFDRIGIIVKIGDQEKLYDFEESVPNHCQNAWYIKGVNLLEVSEEGGSFRKLDFPSGVADNQVFETHNYFLNETTNLTDSLHMMYKGSFADNIRDKYYSTDSKKIPEEFQSEFLPGTFSVIDSVVVNNFYEENQVNLTIAGMSFNKSEKVDSFLVIKPQEKIFSELYNKLFSTSRKNHIQFDAPFRYRVEYNIPVPKGYEIKSVPEKVSLTTQFQGYFTLAAENKGTELKVTGVLQFPQDIIEVGQFPKVLDLIENSKKEMNKEIVFRKITL